MGYCCSNGYKIKCVMRMYLMRGDPVNEIFTYTITKKTIRGHILSEFISWFIKIHMTSRKIFHFTIIINDNISSKNIFKFYDSKFKIGIKGIMDLGRKIFYSVYIPYIQNNINKYDSTMYLTQWIEKESLLPPSFQD